MKLLWAFVVAAVLLFAQVSAASIERDSGSESTQWWQWWKYPLEILKGVGDRIKNIFSKLTEKFNNIRDSFSRHNAEANKCLEKFKRDFEAAVDKDELANQKEYAAYVNSIADNTANAKNISVFEENFNNIKISVNNIATHLRYKIAKINVLVAVRVQCTYDAYRGAGGSRGTTAAPVTTDSNGGKDEATTPTSDVNTNVAPMTTDSNGGRDQGTTPTSDVNTNAATESATEKAADTATDSVTNIAPEATT